MEYVNFERFEEVKWLIKVFLVFLTIPALSWWWNYIKGFFIEIYEDDNNNCCPHCHIHIDDEPDSQPTLVPKPDPMPPSGGMAVPPMKIPSKEHEYDYLDRK